MPVAGAIIGGVASLAGGAIAAGGAKSAANAQAASAAQGLAEQQREFNINQQNYAPWLAAGKSALQQQLDLLGLGGGPSTGNWTAYLQQNPDVQAGWEAMSPADKQQFPTPEAYAQWHYQNYGQNEGRTAPGLQSAGQVQQGAIDQLQASPLYQSLFRNGRDAILNSAAATGGLRGGNTASSLANFGADTLSQVIQNQLANLGGISNTGNASAGNLGSLNGQTANAMGNLYAQQGSAQAGGILGSTGIWNNAFNGVGKALGGLFNRPAPLGSNGFVTPSPDFVAGVGQTMNQNGSIF